MKHIIFLTFGLLCACKFTTNKDQNKNVTLDTVNTVKKKILNNWWENDSVLFGMNFNQFIAKLEIGDLPDVNYGYHENQNVYNAKITNICGYPAYIIRDQFNPINLAVYSLPPLHCYQTPQGFNCIQEKQYTKHVLINLNTFNTMSNVGILSLEKSGFKYKHNENSFKKRVILNEVFHLKYSIGSNSHDEFLSDCLSAYDIDSTDDSWLPFFANRAGDVIMLLIGEQDLSIPNYQEITRFNFGAISTILKKNGKYESCIIELRKLNKKFVDNIESNKLKVTGPITEHQKTVFLNQMTNDLSNMIGYLFKEVGYKNLKKIQKDYWAKFLEFEQTKQ